MNDEEEQIEVEEESWGDRLLDPNRPLTPRHRKLAELLARGLKNDEIAKELGYTPSRVSILKSNTQIRSLAEQIRSRVYEESVGQRLKLMAEPALNELEKCLNDQTNRYKEQLKVDTAKWIVEKLDGKAVQKHDLGENILAVVMDRLDAMKASPQNPSDSARDVTPVPQLEAPESKSDLSPEQEALRQWAQSFTTLQDE